MLDSIKYMSDWPGNGSASSPIAYLSSVNWFRTQVRLDRQKILMGHWCHRDMGCSDGGDGSVMLIRKSRPRSKSGSQTRRLLKSGFGQRGSSLRPVGATSS